MRVFLIMFTLSALGWLAGCASQTPMSKQERTPAAKVHLSSQEQLARLLSQDPLPLVPEPEGGSYVYNDVWCPDPKATKWAREHLANAESMNIRITFEENHRVKVTHPSIKPYEAADCMVSLEGEYRVSASSIQYSVLHAVGASKSCDPRYTLEERNMTMDPMIPIYDKQRDKYLIVQSIAPNRLGANYCYPGKRGFQVYEFVPLY